MSSYRRPLRNAWADSLTAKLPPPALPVPRFRFFSPFQRRHIRAEAIEKLTLTCHHESRQANVCPSAGRPCACGLLKIEECHLPTHLPVLTPSPEAPQNLSPDAPKPVSLVSNRPVSIPWCFPRSVHSPAQTQNPHWRRGSRLTPTNHYYLDKIGFVPQSPRKPEHREIRHSATPQSRTLAPPDSSFFQLGSESHHPLIPRTICTHRLSEIVFFRKYRVSPAAETRQVPPTPVLSAFICGPLVFPCLTAPPHKATSPQFSSPGVTAPRRSRLSFRKTPPMHPRTAPC